MSETQPKNIVTPTGIAAALKDYRTAREIHGITRKINCSNPIKSRTVH